MNARRDASPEQTQPMRFVRCAMGRLRRHDRGGAAFEFAIILPFFLAFVFMIFELGMMFAAQELLDNAARDAARTLRIGTYTGSSYASTVKAAICSNISSSTFNRDLAQALRFRSRFRVAYGSWVYSTHNGTGSRRCHDRGSRHACGKD